MSEAVLYRSVSFSYPGVRRRALDEVSLSVPEGAFALAVGPTGSGKTTLLRAANGLVPHFTGGTFSGRVVTGGRDTLDHAPRHLADVIAYVPQDPAASFVLDRVEDELAYGMENLGVAPAHMRRRVEEVLDLLAIEPLRDRSVRSLSGGERQRVTIAAALAAGPRILVLDEPTSQLDPQGAEDVLAALQRLVHDHGMTVLIAEHRLERVAGFVDLAIGCAAGRTTVGSPAEVLERIDSGPPVARLARMLGWSPAPLTVREARAIAGRSVIVPEAPVPAPDPFSPGAALLEADGLVAGYAEREILHGIQLRLFEGEVIVLMGRNGAGKTTLLRCLAGVHRPAAGTVRVRGRTPRPGVDIALCPQEPESVLYCETVAEEIAVTLRARGVDGRSEDELRRFGIEDLAARHPRDCSAGQRLLVATAAMVAGGPAVVLLDEPTRGLDPEAKAGLARFLRSVAEGGGAAIVATHDVELAAAIASRVVMLAAGEVIADGSPMQVLGDSRVFAPQMTRVFGAGWLTPEQVAAAAVPV